MESAQRKESLVDDHTHMSKKVELRIWPFFLYFYSIPRTCSKWQSEMCRMQDAENIWNGLKWKSTFLGEQTQDSRPATFYQELTCTTNQMLWTLYLNFSNNPRRMDFQTLYLLDTVNLLLKHQWHAAQSFRCKSNGVQPNKTQTEIENFFNTKLGQITNEL